MASLSSMSAWRIPWTEESGELQSMELQTVRHDLVVKQQQQQQQGISSMLCYAKSLQSCPTLCDPIDGSPPGSSIPGILQARILEQTATSFSKTRLSTAQKHLRSTR